MRMVCSHANRDQHYCSTGEQNVEPRGVCGVGGCVMCEYVWVNVCAWVCVGKCVCMGVLCVSVYVGCVSMCVCVCVSLIHYQCNQ